jgi:signal transduction histidine kinase
LTAPLNAIKWNIEALKNPEIPIARKSKLLSSIYSQGTILVHLIKNFTLMSNLEVDHELGQFRERPEPVDILRLCINLANDFQPQADDQGQKKVLVNELSFQRALRGKNVQIIKNLIAQAISNLLENAVKYSEYKSTIAIHAELPENPQLSFAICVTSTGLPVGQEESGKLFDRGFRGTAAKQKVPGGTGIGLFLANRVMALHQGGMAVRTKSKETTFSLIFPQSRLV